MSWTYAYYYWLDVISSPVFWFALGLGTLPTNIVWFILFRRHSIRLHAWRNVEVARLNIQLQEQQERADAKYEQAAQNQWANEVREIWQETAARLGGQWPPYFSSRLLWEETATSQENTEEKTE